MEDTGESSASLSRGLLAGAVAGVAASLLMQGFQAAVSPMQAALGNQKKREDGVTEATIATEEQEEQAKESTTEKAARVAMEQVGRPLSEVQTKKAGVPVHYLFGTLMGAGYGVAAEYLPVVALGGGLMFGTILFVLTDLCSLPALGLASKPAETPAGDQTLHWLSHTIYGGSLELTRSLVRKAL